MGWIVLLLIFGLVLVCASMYNRLLKARNAFKSAFVLFDVQLTRRYDLIPNLVEVADGYIRHERETLDALLQALNIAYAGLRSAAFDPANAAAVRQLAGAEQQLGNALARLQGMVAAYPELKVNQQMLQLTEELSSSEQKVAGARQAYNDSVLSYNQACELFPTSLVAGMCNFHPAQLLKVEE